MVIFDNTNNFNNTIKGILYINMMDVDYLMNKYQSALLNSMVLSDYIEVFNQELDQIKNQNKLSEQYYSILSLGIETDEDEQLLKIIKREVEQGNLFTKSLLKSINNDNLKLLIKLLKNNIKQLGNEGLYKLRSYMMAEYIFDIIEISNIYLEKSYDHDISPGTLKLYKNIVSNLEFMGFSSEIVESDYFNDDKVLIKHNIV